MTKTCGSHDQMAIAVVFAVSLCALKHSAVVAQSLSSGSLAVAVSSNVERNIPYGPDPLQRMDVYLPAHPHNAPVLFMVHGGGWIRGDKTMSRVFTNKVEHWLPEGLIFISIDYRMLPEADPLEQANDVAKALAAAQAKMASWGGDPARFVLMGHSAGAHLVALLAADPSIAYRFGAKPWLGSIALDSGAYDITRIMETRHLPLYDQVFGNDPQYWRRTSPTDRISGTPGPMLLVCSTLRNDSCSQARSFSAKATAAGARVTVLPMPLKHSEINENLGLAGSYTDSVERFLRSLGLP